MLLLLVLLLLLLLRISRARKAHPGKKARVGYPSGHSAPRNFNSHVDCYASAKNRKWTKKISGRRLRWDFPRRDLPDSDLLGLPPLSKGLAPRRYGQSPYWDCAFQRVCLKHNLSFKGWNSQAHRISPESLSQAILLGIILVWRLGVMWTKPNDAPPETCCRCPCRTVTTISHIWCWCWTSNSIRDYKYLLHCLNISC